MKLRRRYRLMTALIALVGVLFTQMAVASYRCPGPQGADFASTMAAPDQMQTMPGCDHPDPTALPLCAAHSHDSHSSLDRPNVPAFSPAAMIVSSILPSLAPPISSNPRDPEPDSLLLRITSPPISIRHCCFRI